MKRLLIIVAAVAMAATVGSPAMAKHKKPISKPIDATAPAPDPTNWLGQAAPGYYSVCQGTVPQSRHVISFKATEPGKLTVELNEYEGDWDILLLDSKNRELTYSGSGDLGALEKFTYKVRKADTLKIIACNWAGGPTAKGKYTFVYNK